VQLSVLHTEDLGCKGWNFHSRFLFITTLRSLG